MNNQTTRQLDNQGTNSETIPLLAMKMLGGGVLAAFLSLMLSVLVASLLSNPQEFTGIFLVLLVLGEELTKGLVLYSLFQKGYLLIKVIAGAFLFGAGFYLVEFWLYFEGSRSVVDSAGQLLLRENLNLLPPFLVHFTTSLLLLMGIQKNSQKKLVLAITFWLLAITLHLCYNLSKI